MKNKTFCPNCKCILNKNPKHAEGIWQCNNCNGVFMILTTSKPDFINDNFIEPSIVKKTNTRGQSVRYIYKCSICKKTEKSFYQKKKKEYICIDCYRKRQDEFSKKRKNDATLKKKLVKELGSICQSCGKYENVQLHHIIPIKDGGKTTRENCTILCNRCHKIKHNGRGVGPVSS